MTPTELVRNAAAMALSNEDGDDVSLRLRPPLSADEIDALEKRLPCPLPGEVREMLALCRGFEGGIVDFVDFTGEDCQCGYEEIFPHGHPIAADGCGNFWVVDLAPTSTRWSPIYYACHDAPVILYQSPGLDHFLAELFKSSQPPFESLLNDVYDDRVFNIWADNPGVKSQAECLVSTDPQLRSFAKELAPAFEIIDLRDAAVGFGFSWGRYGPQTAIRRFGLLPIFAYEKPPAKPSLFRRLFS